MRNINKLLLANRGGNCNTYFKDDRIRYSTVAIYSNEDKGSLHRYKADGVLLSGEDLGPADSYLNIERIIDVAKRANIDAIHQDMAFK